MLENWTAPGPRLPAFSRPGRLPAMAVLALLAVFASVPAWAVCPDCDNDGFDDTVDCDDAQVSVFPGAPEQCDNRDNDCDGLVDEDLVDACSTPCGTGTSTCRGGAFYDCTAKPCCDQTIGPGQPVTDLCPAVTVGSQVICVQPGTYAMSCSPAATLVSTGGPAVTTITGNFTSSSLRTQGFTFAGTVSGRGDWIGNVFQAGLTATTNAVRNQIVGNRVTGSLTGNTAYSVRDNLVEGGLVSITAESSATRYVDAVGNTVIGGGIRANRAALVERNNVIGGAIGIETLGNKDVRVAGNVIEDAGVGISIAADPNGNRKYDIARNRIVNPVTAGIRFSTSIPQNSLRLHDNLITGLVPGTSPTSTGILLNVTNTIPFQTPFDLIANTIVGQMIGVDLSCSGCQTLTANFNGNIIAYHVTAGVVGSAVQPLTAQNNDVSGSPVNWSGVADPTGTSGNTSADPQFVSAEDGDFHVLPTSPCFDTGVAHVVSQDLDGLPRGIDGTLDFVATPDMGAFEAVPEIGVIRYSLGPTRLTWDPYPFASTGYDLYSGLISVLKGTGNYSQNPAVCHHGLTEYPVPDAVPLGDALFHHVAPHGTAPGTIGSDGQGHPRTVAPLCP